MGTGLEVKRPVREQSHWQSASSSVKQGWRENRCRTHRRSRMDRLADAFGMKNEKEEGRANGDIIDSDGEFWGKVSLEGRRIKSFILR